MFKLLWYPLLICVVNALDTPIIGILSQEAYLVRSAYPDADSFIAASYVKMIEASGARVIPIWIGQDKNYYERVVNYTNGVVFPGGGTYFNETGGYGEAAKNIYNLAVNTNNRGVYYPIWGICLGMQVLMFAATGGEDIRGDCSSKDVALPLKFEKGYKQSRLFSSAPSDLLTALETKNITYNYHRYCIFEDELIQHQLLDTWSVLSKNVDETGLEFVSSMEHKTLPFYGTQYHPEKAPYEFKRKTAVPHTSEAIRLTQYFGNFFVEEARKNNQSFPDNEMERAALIYNFNSTFSDEKTSYEQLYLFTKTDYTA